jgi:hypothetical protein
MTQAHDRLRGELELVFVLAVILGVWVLQFYTDPAMADSPISPVSPLRVWLPYVSGGDGPPPRPTVRATPTMTPMPTSTPVPLKGVGVIHQYQDQHEDLCADIALAGATQYHNWLPDPPTCPGIQPVCMWWGLSSTGLPVNPDCEVILLWNEPQIAAQSNIAPAVGAAEWANVEGAAADRQFSTPCADIPWLNQWANAFYASHLRWPEFDHVCIHSYPDLMPPKTVQDAVAQTMAEVEAARVWSLAHGGDGAVWLHEFGLWPAWGGDVTEYIEGIVPWLEAQGVPYNWFALSHVGDYMAPSYDTSLVADGALTEYGEAYVR